MALRGDLASVDLAQVFQMLTLNKKVGLLSIQSSRICKVLYFDQRGVTLYYNPHQLLDRAVATFVRIGRIRDTALEEVREHACSNDLQLIDTLLAGGYVGEGELEAQMRYEVEEEIYELFFSKDARFEFLENVDRLLDREGVIDERFFFNTESLIMEAARRIDEWSYITERIPNGLEVFRRTGARPAPSEIGEECAIVYECVDGCHNAARIVEASGLSSFAVFKNLNQLLDGSFIEPLPAEDLIPLGRQCLDDDRPSDAINLFEKAVELDVGVPDVHGLAARAYEAITEFEHASHHLHCAAEFKIGAEDWRGAAEDLQAAVALIPTDLGARERLVGLALKQPQARLPDFDPYEEGKVLVGLLVGAGELARVRSILEGLVAARPEDLELKKILVTVHTKAGDQARVAELYESIADDLVADHRPIEAIAYLQKILMLDRSRSGISERIRALYAQDERLRGRRRFMAAAAAVALLLAVLAVAYSFYNRAGTAAFEQVDVQRYLDAEQYDQAIAVYAQVMTSYPLTAAVGLAEDQVARIKGLQNRQAVAAENERAARERDYEALRHDYLRQWRRHSELFLAGKPEAALVAAERVGQLLATGGRQADLAWAVEVKFEEALTRLREFVAAAQGLEHRLVEELAAGQVANAWALAVELARTYDITQAAQRSPIPVWIESRPRGAQLMRDGVPVVQEVDGVATALVTPTVLLCDREPRPLTLQVDGFESAQVQIKPLELGAYDVHLQPRMHLQIDFAEDVQTAIGASSDWIVAGLRNGLVGVADARSGEVGQVLQLDGLGEVQGTPVVVGDRVWLLTTEQALECYHLPSGRAPAGWPVRLSSASETELVAGNGRLWFVDQEHVLRCYDQGSGDELWSYRLPSPVVGAPSVRHRGVMVACLNGSLLQLDALNGAVTKTLRVSAGIRTAVGAHADKMFFGCDDGHVYAIDMDGRVIWSAGVGRAVGDQEFLATESGVFALAGDGMLVRLDVDSGARLAATQVSGSASGLRQLGDQLLLAVRSARTEGRASSDSLQAFRAGDLSLLWEYRDEGVFTGAPTTNGRWVAVAGASGDVALFR